MLAIKKIGRVAPVERKWLESRKRTERRGCPLPSVAQQIMHTEGALAIRKRIYGRRIPAIKIEIAALRIGHFVAPGIPTRPSVARAIRRPLPLRFRGKRLPCPTSIGRSLRLTHIDGPIERCPVERRLCKHSAPIPLRVSFFPECRMRNLLRTLPVPICFVPKGASLVAAIRHELKKLPVGYLVAIDFESGNVGGMSFILIVPAEGNPVFRRPTKPQIYLTSRN